MFNWTVHTRDLEADLGKLGRVDCRRRVLKVCYPYPSDRLGSYAIVSGQLRTGITPEANQKNLPFWLNCQGLTQKAGWTITNDSCAPKPAKLDA